MAQRTNDRRMERREKSERNMNRAVVLLIAGLAAEWYLLMVDRYYARGTVDQVIGWYDFFGVIRWVALAVMAAGIVLLVRGGEKVWPKRLGWGLAGCGAFFAFTSFAMRRFYPVSVTVLCVVVPVLLILGIICLFYQAEFTAQACGLALALGAFAMLNRSASTTVKLVCALAAAGIAALIVFVLLMSRKNGSIVRNGKIIRLFDARTDYNRTMAVLALCLALVLLGMAVPSIAFFATWALGIVAFILAVYYTIKLM